LVAISSNMTREAQADLQLRDAADVFSVLVQRLDHDVLQLASSRATVRLCVADGAGCDVRITADTAQILPTLTRQPDATLTADLHTWRTIAEDLANGMAAFQQGRLHVRGNLHVGIGFLAASGRAPAAWRLRFLQTRTAFGNVSTMVGGRGAPLLLIHGLGATKASFISTVAALGDSHRCIALDLPGFGDSDKPLFAAYDARYFSKWCQALLDAFEIERADLVGHSLGGRVAIEVGLQHPERVGRLVLMMPSLAWRRNREWATLLTLVRPELGMLQFTPRPVVERILSWLLPDSGNGWVAAAKDEFLRSFVTPAGRAAFYAAARNIYLEQPHGPTGFWSRLSELQPPSLFIWGRRDGVVPIAFRRHVAVVLPESQHVELDCGHVPQLERPREVHNAIRRFLS
jgi:pimeloyl-ACP methyl ester carboxylesterase